MSFYEDFYRSFGESFHRSSELPLGVYIGSEKTSSGSPNVSFCLCAHAIICPFQSTRSDHPSAELIAQIKYARKNVLCTPSVGS